MTVPPSLQVKLWDPKAPKEICALYPHKNTVTVLRWHPEGNHVLSGSRDNLLKARRVEARTHALQRRGAARCPCC